MTTSRHFVHPLRPQGSSFVPHTEVVAAVVTHNQSGGAINVLIPSLAESLKDLFEQPVRDDQGQWLEAWSPAAVEYLCRQALPKLGFAAIEVAL